MPVPRSSDGLCVGSRVELTVESLVSGGDGLARLGGRVVFVPAVAVGDVVLAEVVEMSRAFARARVVEIRRPGPARRDPPCPRASTCGGCAWQHLDETEQRRAKVAIVRDALARLAGLHWESPIEIVHGDALAYRTRADLVVTRAADGRPAWGYRAAQRHDVVPVDACPVLVPELDAVVAHATRDPSATPRRAVGVRLGAGENGVRVVFLDARGDVVPPPPDATRARAVRLASAPHDVVRTVDGIVHAFDARAFWQAHATLLAPLVARACRGLGGETALDLYCGAGLFTLHLARRFARVTGVESDPRSVARATETAHANRIANVEFVARDVASFLREAPRVDVVLVDPPRRGLEPGVVEALAGLAPREVRYVSCDPATLARDLRALVASGYDVRDVTAFDLFPQTPHVETVVDLGRG